MCLNLTYQEIRNDHTRILQFINGFENHGFDFASADGERGVRFSDERSGLVAVKTRRAKVQGICSRSPVELAAAVTSSEKQFAASVRVGSFQSAVIRESRRGLRPQLNRVCAWMKHRSHTRLLSSAVRPCHPPEAFQSRVSASRL